MTETPWSSFSIGTSVLGRSIEAHRIGSRSAGDQLLLFGAIHGDEPESAILCQRLLGEKVTCQTVVIPILNPDGLTAKTKDNARGVDLNRNFSARSWKAEHPPGYFPGTAPLSEPEAAALAHLIRDTNPKVLIAVHQPFRCVNWDGPAEKLAAEMAAIIDYPSVASVGYPTPGSFGACYGVDGGIPVITLELPRSPVEDDFVRCVAALRHAANYVTL